MKPQTQPFESEQEEYRHSASVLSRLIWATGSAYLFVILVNLYYADWKAIAVTLAGGALLIAAWVLLRRGHLRVSSLFFVLSALFTVTVIATVGQGIRDLGIVAFPIIFIFAGLALDRRLFRVCVGLALVAVSWLALGETYGLFVTKPFDGEMSNWLLLILVIFLLLIAALAVDLLTANMRKSLELARREIAQRKRAEQSLSASEEKFKAQYKGMPIPTYSWQSLGEDLILVDYNDSALEFTQGRVRDLLGQTASAIYRADPDTLNELLVCSRTKVNSKRERWQREASTGEMQFVAFNYAFVPPDLVMVHTEDMTERKNAETRNRIIAEVQDILLHPCELKDIYQLVSEKVNQLIGDGITATSILDERNTTLRMGAYHGVDIPFENLLSVIGFDPWQKEFSLDTMADEDLSVYRNSKLGILEGGLYALMTRVVPKPACLTIEKLLRVRKIYGMGFVHEEAHLGGLIILARGDITPHIAAIEQIVNLATMAIERKRAEEALRESEARLSSIFNTTGDVIFLLDVEQDGEYRFNTVNPAFLSVTGLPAESVVGRSVTEVIPEPSLALVLSNYGQAIQEKTIVRWEETSDYPTGRRTALVAIAPILDADGTCRHLVGQVHDITVRKQAEEEIRCLNAGLERRVEERTAELRLARDAAEAANRAKSAFLAIMGHELRTPLNGIHLAAEMLREHGLPAPEQKKYAEVILGAGHRLLQMVEGVLEYTGIGSKSDATPLDVALTLQEAGLRFEARARQKNIRLAFDLAPGLPPLQADVHRLDKMLRRLIDNALKFTPEGGRVTVAARVVAVADAPAKSALQIAVTDTGPGLRPEDCERIFEPFVQLEASYLAHSEGAGLGLTLARRQAEAQGGRLWAESGGKGQGSSFILEFPVP